MKIPSLQHMFSLQKPLVLTKKPKPKHNNFFFNEWGFQSIE